MRTKSETRELLIGYTNENCILVGDYGQVWMLTQITTLGAVTSFKVVVRDKRRKPVTVHTLDEALDLLYG